MELTDSMLLSGIILGLTFLGIFTETFHGIARAKFAIAGAGAMIVAGQVLGFYSPDLAIRAIDWNVIFLLAIMMVIVSIMASTGGFERLAMILARMSGGHQYGMLLLLGTAVAIISLLFDNVTTVIIFGPLIILICQTMGVSPVPYLLATALLADAAGVATLVGDPASLLVGAAAGIDFNSWLVHLGLPVLLAWLGIVVSLWFLFGKELKVNVIQQFDRVAQYRNKSLWYKSLFVVAVMLILFTVQHHIGWQAWMVAGASLTLLLFMTRKVELDAVTAHVEAPLLAFFISIFIVIGGVEQSGLLARIGQHLAPLITEHPQLAALALLWVVAVLSMIIDNVPLTAAMIPVLSALQHEGVNVSVLWWALALGVGMGGNGTHIGSTANVYIVTISQRLAREKNNPALTISPAMWLRKGLPATLVTLCICSLFLWFEYDFLNLEGLARAVYQHGSDSSIVQ